MARPAGRRLIRKMGIRVLFDVVTLRTSVRHILEEHSFVLGGMPGVTVDALRHLQGLVSDPTLNGRRLVLVTGRTQPIAFLNKVAAPTTTVSLVTRRALPGNKRAM